MFGLGKIKVSYKEAAQWLCAMAFDNITNPRPSYDELVSDAEANGFDRADFEEELLWLSLFVIGASIKTARDRGVIKPGEFTILFPEYIEELQRRFLRLESEARDNRYHSALHCLEMLNERSAEYGRGMEMARGNTTKLLIAVGIQFTFFMTGQQDNKFCRDTAMASYVAGNEVIKRLSRMKLHV